MITSDSQAQTDFSCGQALTDFRDGQSYKTVQIGQQCWMAENLNVGKQVDNIAQTDNQIIEKSCYDNKAANCETYGGLYSWPEAMQYSREAGTQGVCPEGWHLPTKEEWETLSQSLGVEEAGQKLKADKTNAIAWDGNNESGFTAIPSGVGYQTQFGRQGQWAAYWSSTAFDNPQIDNEFAWFSQLDGYWYEQPPKYKILYIGNYFITENAFSIRCVKDND